MESNRVLYVGLILFLLAVDCSILDFKLNVSAKTDDVQQDSQSNNKKDSNEQGGQSMSVSDSNGADKGKKNEENHVDNILDERTGGDKKNINIDNLSSQSGSEKDRTKINNSNNDLSSQSESKKTDNPENGTGDLKGKEKPGESNVNKGDNDGLVSKDTHVEECDPSNMCTDKENQLVACIRVPGNGQKYSLLVQNKGKNPLKVTISAPKYVQLDKTEIQLHSKEDKQVQVSITDRGSDNLIVLRAANGHCNLDIKHLVAEELDNYQKSSYLNFVSHIPTIVVLAFATLLILAAGWTCISFRRKQLSSSGSKYQRLDMELPVSAGGEPESGQNDGWDDKWGDDWDDEEAPKTPSLPVTPSLSSKGLASRRLSKEGWKD